MRGWLMWRCSARSLTFSSPAWARRSRMRRRVGLAKARKWSGSSFRGFWRNIKVALCTSIHKGWLIYQEAGSGAIDRLGAAHQVEELGSGARVAAEGAEHARGHHVAARRLDPPHLHAQVARLHDDTDTPGGERLVERLGDLPGQLLLELQAVREDLDEARDLAQTDDLAIWQITHVDVPEERQHVVLAQTVEVDVLDHDHLVVVLVEDRVGDHVLGTHAVAVGQLAQRARHPVRRGLQTLTLRVFAELDKQRFDKVCDRVAGLRLRCGHCCSHNLRGGCARGGPGPVRNRLSASPGPEGSLPRQGIFNGGLVARPPAARPR